MLLCVPVAAALTIALATPEYARHARHVRKTRSTARIDRSERALTEIALRRRLARMERLARLEQRERMLRDFLIRAHSERHNFSDDEAHLLGVGLRIGPTLVTRDFLGSPIIRARVQNGQTHSIFALLEAHIRTADGETQSAAIALSLQAGESRDIELLCPTTRVPKALFWTATAL